MFSIDKRNEKVNRKRRDDTTWNKERPVPVNASPANGMETAPNASGIIICLAKNFPRPANELMRKHVKRRSRGKARQCQKKPVVKNLTNNGAIIIISY